MQLTQENMVLNFLALGGKFNTQKARELGIANPSAVVNNLRNKGHLVYHNRRKNGRLRSFWTLSFGGVDVASISRKILNTVLYT
jgi:hypothetical protein